MRRVLIVEDDPMVAWDLGETVQELGKGVLLASTVEKALDLAESEEVESAILDISLTGEKVFPVAERLQAHKIPFIFVTGYNEQFLPPELRYATCLYKPVGRDKLAEALRTLTRDR